MATVSSGWFCSARGRAATRKATHYDIAVFLQGFASRWEEIDRIVPLVTEILYEHGIFIHAMPHQAGAYEDRTPLMREIRREGIDL